MAENFLGQDENQTQKAKLVQRKTHKTRHTVRKDCQRAKSIREKKYFQRNNVSLTADFSIATIEARSRWNIFKALRDTGWSYSVCKLKIVKRQMKTKSQIDRGHQTSNTRQHETIDSQLTQVHTLCCFDLGGWEITS